MKARLYIILSILISFSSCGIPLSEEQVKKYSVIPEAKSLVDDYVADRRILDPSYSVDDLVVKFGNLEYPTLGTCVTGTTVTQKFLKNVIKKTPVVTLNVNTWYVLSSSTQKGLVTHELGHCLEKRDHRDDVLPTGQPASVMNTYLLSGELFQDNYNYYMKELFGQLSNNSLSFTYSGGGNFASNVKEESGGDDEYFYHHKQVGEEGIDDCVYSHKEEIINEIEPDSRDDSV